MMTHHSRMIFFNAKKWETILQIELKTELSKGNEDEREKKIV